MKRIKNTKNIIAWIGVSITIIISSIWSYWGIFEFFHEGWHSVSVLNSLFLFFVQYISFTIIFILFPILAIYNKRAGLISFISMAIFAAWFFAGASFQVVHLFITIPLISIGALYYYGELKNKKIAIRLIIAIPVSIIIIFGPPQLIKVLKRIDDGNYDTRILDCQNQPLAWAPRGSGFPEKSFNWSEAMNICQHLSEDGTTILEEKMNIWRLPTIEEAVRCQMIHNENAGGYWNEEKRKAKYSKNPDKETPLWIPDHEVIYYWTQELSQETENQAYIIDYKGGIFDKDIRFSPAYISFRCVKNHK